MNFATLDSKNPVLSLVTRVGLILIIITALVCVFSNSDVWVLAPMTIAISLMTLIIAFVLARRK